VYYVYLRSADGKIVGDVRHLGTRDEAADAFASIVNCTDYDGFDLIAILKENNRPVAIHRFAQSSDHIQSWRGRLHALPFTTQH
jgi:hypothetical protein